MNYEVPYVFFPATVDLKTALHGNAKGAVMIVVGQDEWDQPALRELLERILKSVGLEVIDQCILVLGPAESYPFRQLVSALNQKKLLIFGLDPSRLQLAIGNQLYTRIARGERSLFFVHPLKAYLTDRNQKMKLWELLKKHLV